MKSFSLNVKQELANINIWKNNDEILDSIMDAEGITFNVKDKKTGPYSLEMPFRK